MYIKKFNIRNFKSFKNVVFHFNSDVNILTGKNNTGKTTVLEALSLWHECFGKLINKAKRGEAKHNYKAGDWVLGTINNKYFPFDEINSVRSPYFEDIFHQRNRKNKIELSALIYNEKQNNEIEICFKIGESGMNYIIELENYKDFNFRAFNEFFQSFPEPIGKYYGSPVAVILQKEDFATDPQIKNAILNRSSSSVLRNRIYKLLTSPRKLYKQDFYADLAYILGQKIELIVGSDIEKDTQVIINFKQGEDDIEKDIALLGSGTLQIFEILLNVYQPDEAIKHLDLFNREDLMKDFTILLLDEPDSHIHRDIQQRLIKVLTRFSEGRNQIFISTHNESLIRSADHYQLFHLDGKMESEIKSIDKEEIKKIAPHFKGIYPSELSPIIRSLGNTSGLDFVNAIEADCLIFVEGEDDARVIHCLLKQQTPPSSKKYMFWVLGGISTALSSINAYKTVFSAIKNGKSLWEKSCFIFDKDYLSSEHKNLLCLKLKENLGLNSYSWNAYTLESVLLTDINKLTKLLLRWIEAKNNSVTIEDLQQKITEEYQNYKVVLEQRFTEQYQKNTYFQVKNTMLVQAEKIVDKKLITLNEPEISIYIQNNYTSVLNEGDYYKLMNKDDVGNLINKVLQTYSLNFSIESHFIELIRFVDKSLWFDEWDFLMKL